MFDNETVVRYVYNSNRLDGVTLSEAQTRQVVEQLVPADATLTGDDGREFEAEVVAGHDRALKGMAMLATSDRPLTQDAIQTLHKMLMGELLLSAGEYRECILRYKGLLIASPPEYLGERMKWLVDLVNAGLEKAQDPALFAWRVHHEFITLHPFIEANGRMARLLLNAVRMRRGLDLLVVPFDNREAYSKAIIEFQQQKIRRAQEKAGQA